jgi:hypothetical protein
MVVVNLVFASSTLLLRKGGLALGAALTIDERDTTQKTKAMSDVSLKGYCLAQRTPVSTTGAGG